jgi:signal transduction histidine kinase
MNFERFKLMLKGMPFVVILWFSFAAYYALAIKYNFYPELADYFACLVQVIADLFMAFFSILVIISAKNLDNKRFYLLLAVSILPGLISTETYNVLVNIVKIQHVNSFMNEIWIFPYTFFLIFQIPSWLYVLSLMRDEHKKSDTTWVSKSPYIQLVMVLLLSGILATAFNGIFTVHMGFFQKLNTGLEIILFNLLTTCLSRTKNKSLVYIEVGFLCLIAFNLAHRFSYLTGHNFKSFDIVWLLSYVVIIYGYSLSVKNNDESIEFFSGNSMHVLISALFMMFSTFLFLIFLSLGFVISSYEINDIASISIFPENIPSVLVFSFLLSALFAKAIASHFSSPLERISKRIDLLSDSKINKRDIEAEKFDIFEVEKLDKFIMNTVAALHESNSIKSKFLMSMSHDFRTPASGIYHMSRTVYKRINDEELKGFQKLIVDSSERLMNLLEDVLDYSRLDSDQYGLNIADINIQSIVNDIVFLVKPKINEKTLYINVLFSKPTFFYRGDKLLVNRILLNIISNAIKFTHIGGITISVGSHRKEGNNWLCVKIVDTGIGIDESNHKIIFEPFTKVGSPETSEYPGIGLGLSNVVLMLKKLGGEITLESSLNNGSVFSVFLPIS